MDKNAGLKKPPSTAQSGSSEDFSFKNPLWTGILFATLIVFLTIMYFYIRTKKRGRGVLLVGPSDSGKTSIFSKLVYGRTVDTVTSTTPNIGEIEIKSKAPLTLKDLPGHERVRMKYFEAHKVGMRAIICILDAAGGSKAVREAAEVLYDVLSDSLVQSIQPYVLIFANKQDLPTAKASSSLKHQLEREITTLRLTRSAGLKTIAGKSNEAKFLGKADRDFEFEQLAPLQVEFLEGIGNQEESNLKEIHDWLRKIA